MGGPRSWLDCPGLQKVFPHWSVASAGLVVLRRAEPRARTGTCDANPGTCGHLRECTFAHVCRSICRVCLQIHIVCEGACVYTWEWIHTGEFKCVCGCGRVNGRPRAVRRVCGDVKECMHACTWICVLLWAQAAGFDSGPTAPQVTISVVEPGPHFSCITSVNPLISLMR